MAMPKQLHGQTGSALLSVLLILGVVSALMVTLLSGMATSVKITQNAQNSVSARYQANAAEALARLELQDILARNTGALANVGAWNGSAVRVPLDRGVMTLHISDHTACFNVNALVAPGQSAQARQAALGATGLWPTPDQRFRGSLQMQRQFTVLLEALDFGRGEAQRLTAAIADWIDSDSIPTGLGAEDGAYASQKARYRTANQLMRSVSELLDVRGITPEIYERLAPWLCAHPTTQPAAINVNLLQQDQAPLLMMLLPRALTRDMARRVLADVPPTGWQSTADFWTHPALAGLQPGTAAIEQTVTRSRFFTLNVQVAMDTGEAEQTALFEITQTGPQLAARTWQERL